MIFLSYKALLTHDAFIMHKNLKKGYEDNSSFVFIKVMIQNELYQNVNAYIIVISQNCVCINNFEAIIVSEIFSYNKKI